MSLTFLLKSAARSVSRFWVVDCYMDIICSRLSLQVVQEAGPSTGRGYGPERGGNVPSRNAVTSRSETGLTHRTAVQMKQIG